MEPPASLLLLTIFVLLPMSSTAADHEDGTKRNCSDLQSFKKELEKNNKFMEQLWSEQNCSPRNRVAFDGKGGISSLNLSNLNLNGTIPSLSNFTTLVTLDLSHNNFSGNITYQGIGSLQRLEHLDLSWNSLDGVIPTINNCPNLTFFNLENNKLNGSLQDFQLCQKLTHFLVGNNSLGGSLPDVLLGHPSLLSLNVSGNSLNGTIPNPKVSDVNVGGNLAFLDLSNNNFTGWDPSNFCSNLKKLEKLNVSGNHLGSNGWSDLNQLFTSCSSLSELDLSNNGYSWSFLDSPINLPPKLVDLRLRGNTITGNKSTVTQNSSILNVLDMGSTSLSGNLSFIYNLTNLKELSLDHNHLDGTIAEEVGNLTSLTSLDVSHNNLSGPIPSSLEYCKQLKFLYLQNNSFNGTIPEQLSNLSSLEIFNVSNNNLTGYIPSGGIFDKDGDGFIHEGNDGLKKGKHTNAPLPSIPPNGSIESSKKSKAVPAVIIVVAIIVFVAISSVLFYKCRYFTKIKQHGSFKGLPFRKVQSMTIADLHDATDGFSSNNLIGSGAIGSVYKGSLEHEQNNVAVKVINKESLVDPVTLKEEISKLKGIATHGSLVKIVGSFENVEVHGEKLMALVYELMPNGNLSMWLHHDLSSNALKFRRWFLSLHQRLNMAIDVASALVHLHHQLDPPVVHCNLKPNNVLISEDMTAHLTDFRLNRCFPMLLEKSDGYKAPECDPRSPISPMWDVYSFGILLLEIFTGLRPTYNFDDDSDLHGFVLKRSPLNLEEVVDRQLLSEERGKLDERQTACVMSILHIALICSNESPQDRMQMNVALEKLQLAKLNLLEVGGSGAVSPKTFGRAGSTEVMLP